MVSRLGRSRKVRKGITGSPKNDLNEPSRLFKVGSVFSTPHCYLLTVFCFGTLENTTGE